MALFRCFRARWGAKRPARQRFTPATRPIRVLRSLTMKRVRRAKIPLVPVVEAPRPPVRPDRTEAALVGCRTSLALLEATKAEQVAKAGQRARMATSGLGHHSAAHARRVTHAPAATVATECVATPRVADRALSAIRRGTAVHLRTTPYVRSLAAARVRTSV